MAAICLVNPKAELARAADALSINIDAAKGIQDVMKSNLGPTGTMKMLVSGAGDIKITKDGNVLLQEMHIKHPTASLIARASTAMDDILGDGTTSAVLFIGELLRQASTYLSDGLHPSILTEGFNTAKDESLKILHQLRIPVNVTHAGLLDVARTSFKTKLHRDLADLLADISVQAILFIHNPDKDLDLHAIEILSMKHKSATDTVLVQGLVLDHGSRHPDMPKRLENAYILTCNVSMEYEKTEVNSSFFYNTTEEREKLLTTERIFIEQRVTNIINLKKKLCDNTDKSFVVINQQGIDLISLEMLAKEGIIALRRAKRRNMERLTLACGGESLNCLNEVAEEHLGFAGLVYEQILGEDKFTFVEQCKIPRSVTVLVKGPDKHTLIQIKDALRDGLRAVKNALDDKFVIPGAGTFEITASQELIKFKDSVKGNLRLGIQAYADALLVIPKMLAVNSGFDSLDTIVKLIGEYSTGTGPVGLDVKTGEPLLASTAGIFDNYSVKKEILNSATVIACNLLMVDEIMRAGLLSLKM